MGSPVTVRAEPSFIHLLYAFTVDQDDAPREDGDSVGAAVLAAVKSHARDRGWVDRRIHTDYVLPHLAEHMNAEHPGDTEDEVGHWWRFDATLPREWVLHASASREILLGLTSVDFILYRTGIGMLRLGLEARSDSIEDWQDALHLSRFYDLPGAGPEGTTARRSSIFARRAKRITAVDGACLAGGDALVGHGRHGFGHLVAHLMGGLLDRVGWQRSAVPGLLTPYSAFFVDWKEADERARHETLYRWRRQLRSSATVAAAGQDDLHADLRAYADQMWLAYSSEGGGFFAADAPRDHFFDHELPDHLRRPYAFGYLLALHQRLALAAFSGRIARVVTASRGQWTADSPPPRALALLQDDFLEYLTRCHFAQVLRTANHHANYKAWEEVLEVPAFAREVEQQLRHLYERSVVADRIIDEGRRTDMSGRLNAAVLGITLPTVVLAILTVVYPAGLALALTVGLTAGSALTGAAIGWLAATYSPRSPRARDRKVSRPSRPRGRGPR